VLQTRSLPETKECLLNSAHKNSERLVRQINDILDIEKLESGQVVFDLKRVEVKSLVEQVIEANHGFAEGHKVRLRLSPASVTANVRADPDRLTQVITNLLSNAIKFSPPDEEVLVSIVVQRGTVCISVRDHGYGIPDEFKAHIFEKFAQADATDKRNKGGTGLGLSIVKSIVDRLGGEASFDEASSGGTIFSVELPIWEEAITMPARLSPSSNLSLLLCEDDPKAAVVLCERLNKEGFLTDVAMTADEAITKVATTPYAAILVDLQLPDGDGIDLIKRLRSQPQIYNTLLVMLSADPNESSGEERPSTLLNILDWLDTPIDVDRLVRVLDRPSVRKAGAHPHILHLDSDPDVLRLVAKALGGTANVMSVESIEEARRALAANRFDVAVLDMALAVGSGIDLLHDLRDSEGDALPIVVFSPEEENPIFATQVRAALIKSRASVDSLVATLRKRLIDGAPVPQKKDVA